MPKPETPVLDRRSAIIDESNAIGRFLDWLSEQGLLLGKWGHETYTLEGTDKEYEGTEDRVIPWHEGPSAMLHRYFEIDPNAEEKELRALLKWTAEGAPLA